MWFDYNCKNILLQEETDYYKKQQTTTRRNRPVSKAFDWSFGAMMNTLAVIVFLSIFVARSHTKGEDKTLFESTNKLQQSQPSLNSDELESKLTVFKAETFTEGSNVTLKCGSEVVRWNELIYIVWNISLQSRKCWLGKLTHIPDSTCKDGKILLNSTDGVSLFIPKISKEDEGSYSCDVSYNGGSYSQKVNVSVEHFSSGLEVNNSQTEQNTMHDLTNQEIIIIVVASTGFILVPLAVVYILHRKLNSLSALKMLCCKSKTSTPAEDKPTQLPDVEEVEPYASYIQRVNSIYNSSSELFNA